MWSTPLEFVTLLRKKKSTINISYKESCTLVSGEFPPSPLSPGQQMGTQNSQPLPFLFGPEMVFKLCQPTPVPARMEFFFSTMNLPPFVPKNQQHPALWQGNKPVAKEIALCRQCLIQKLWSCDNCPSVFMQ